MNIDKFADLIYLLQEVDKVEYKYSDISELDPNFINDNFDLYISDIDKLGIRITLNDLESLINDFTYFQKVDTIDVVIIDIKKFKLSQFKITYDRDNQLYMCIKDIRNSKYIISYFFFFLIFFFIVTVSVMSVHSCSYIRASLYINVHAPGTPCINMIYMNGYSYTLLISKQIIIHLLSYNKCILHILVICQRLVATYPIVY